MVLKEKLRARPRRRVGAEGGAGRSAARGGRARAGGGVIHKLASHELDTGRQTDVGSELSPDWRPAALSRPLNVPSLAAVRRSPPRAAMA